MQGKKISFRTLEVFYLMSNSIGSGFWKTHQMVSQREKYALSTQNISETRSSIAGINWHKKLAADVNGVTLFCNKLRLYAFPSICYQLNWVL